MRVPKKKINSDTIDQEMCLNSKDLKIFANVLKLESGHELRQLVDFKVVF